jgi:hypothetical protein
MGVAAYNRSSAVIRAQIQNEKRDPVFEMMDMINAAPKIEDRTTIGRVATMPFEQGIITFSHGVYWLENAKEPLGEHWAPNYPTLMALVRSWDISLIGYDENTNAWFVINN